MSMPAPSSRQPYYPPRRSNGCLWGCLIAMLLLYAILASLTTPDISPRPLTLPRCTALDVYGQGGLIRGKHFGHGTS